MKPVETLPDGIVNEDEVIVFFGEVPRQSKERVVQIAFNADGV